ncbi:hypothetical protein OnM2_059080 [Erysiphe neolycopersici]|uniref:CCHC-type domain-containing protein n=1 Tax=Erysiphe neolycopersici TaxID=212602 RepID=A0A420HQ53_9PEZI|nr:hypothetical protein OnM2_059080 [Erysiphe neolycopersici]
MEEKRTYPTFQISGKFDGSMPAVRWLNQLICDLQPHYEKVTAEVFFEAISILFVGEAGDGLDSSPEFTKFIDKEEEPNTKDMEDFKMAVMKRFPRKKLEKEVSNVQEDIQNLQQELNEPLNSYYDRAQELLRRSNGRDDQEAGTEPLSILERTILSIIIKSFVRGIRDNEVRTIILTKSTILSGSLRSAFEKTKKAIATISQREEIEKERIEKLELEHFRNQYLREWGRPLSAALAERNQGQGRPSYKNQNLVGYEGNITHCRRSEPVGQSALPLQQQRRTYEDQRVPGREQGPQLHEQAKGSNFMQGTQRGPAPKSQERGNITGRGYPIAEQNPENNPPRNLSRNQFVNLSTNYSKEMGVLCIRCGNVGHKKPECVGPQLEWWEQTYLRELIWPKVNANYARWSDNKVGLKYRDIEDSNWRQNYQKNSKSDENSNNSSNNDEVQRMSFEEFTGEEYIKTGDHASKSMSVILGFENKNTKESEQEPGKKVRFKEEGMEKVVTLDSFLNHGDPRKRGRPLNIEEPLKKEHEPKIRKKEIKRCYGMGPINYKKIAQEIKVEVSLMDLFQISPDLSKAFRNLSSRVNEKKVKERIRNELPTARGAGKSSSIADSEVLLGKAAGPLRNNVEKAFRVPVVVKTLRDGKIVRVSLPLEVAQADQGSDMIIVTIRYLKKLGLPVKSLTERGFEGLTMNVANV